MKHIDRNAEYYNAYSQKEFYKGTSFRVHKWTPDSYYFNNEQYVDWVIYNGALCVCARTHVSSEDNVPVLIYNQGVPVNIEPNPCWDFALGGLAFTSHSPLADTTRVKLENNILYISNDEGKTWDNAGSVIIENTLTNVTADVVSVNDSDHAMANVTVVNDNHLQFSFSLPRGKDGSDGNDGENGKDGADGQDGNGFDYIFCLTETSTFDKLDPSSLEAVQNDLFVPEGWTTYAQQVTETNEYQWVSTRKKTNSIWGNYSKPVILNSYATEGIVPEVSFTSFVFCRTNSTWTDNDNLPTGGSYESPYPEYPGTIGGNEVKWTDSIPAGTHQVWMTSRVFSTQDTSTTWSVPRVLTDTANFQVEYSKELVYKNPEHLQSYYDADSINYEENWRAKNSTWSDEGTDAIWMATATMHNGVWSDWTVNKIKGEDGNDGTPINVIGEVATFEELPDCSTYDGNHGDAYIVTSYEGQSKVMFVYTGDDENCWLNIGPLSVQGAFLHIKYAKTLYDGTDTWNDWSDNNGETPDDYIGIYWDSVEDDSKDPSKYTWKKWTGEDGWGYEYIYQANNTGEAPKVPATSEQNNGYVPDGWSDDPINISYDMQYCWMCYRRKVNNIWTRWYGAQNDINYAALWSKWGQDGPEGPQGPAGEDGAGVEYIFKRSTVDSINFSDTGFDLPNNEWEYDNPGDDWTDDPKGVTIEYPVEWVCERVKPQGESKWSDWGKPAVFSHYGKDGIDGPGVEYVFILDDIDPYVNGNVVIPNHIKQITTLSANQDIDYEPEYDGYKWQDDVQQVTKLLPYCWCSIRRKKNGVWGQFETPTLWNQYIEGTTRVLVKIWKRTDTELTFDKRNAPANASYNVSTGIVTLDSGSANGWSSSEVLTGGKYLYSLGAHVVYNNSTEEVIINSEDWTVLTLESVNGTDGTGQSAVTMTVDPDSILVNVDNNNQARISLNVPCTANYYYGTSLQDSTFSYDAPDGITITDGIVENLEHRFQINIPAGFELKNSMPVTITLSPNVTALENSDNSITELSPLSKKIYLNPIKSNDTWSIDLSTDQIVDHDDLDITVTANIIKNDTIYTGDDAKLTYLWGSETEEEFPSTGLNITHNMVDDIGNEIVVILKVNDQSILHQSISILRNGSSGNDGVGIENIWEYYLWSSDGNDIDGFDENSFVGSDVNTPGSNVTINNTTWTANEPDQFDPTKPYLWNIELLQYTNGEFKTTAPALISKSGKGIESITEWYLVSEQKSGVTFEHENGIPTDPNWITTYYQTTLTENQVVWNVEVIKYDDGTYFATEPIIIGMYSKGEDGQSIGDIFEYYIYTEDGTTPIPNWTDDLITWGEDGTISAGRLFNTNGTEEWTLETIPSMPEGKPCLWNVEVIAYADSGDKYDHTSVVLLSNRAMEIKSIDEYYLATSQELGVSFNKDNIGNWTLVGPNVAVPNTDETNKYLWNAELITYVDGNKCYTIPARIGVYIKGDKGDDADPVYSIILDRYEEFPLYVQQGTSLSWLNDTYSFNMSFYKNNKRQVVNSDFTITSSNKQITVESCSTFDFKLKLNNVISAEFGTTISFIDPKTGTTLSETQITFIPKQATLTVSLDPDTINLGHRKTAYSTETSNTYSAQSFSSRFKAYLNDEEISGKLLTVTIDQTNLSDDLKEVLSNVTPVTGILHDNIILDYTLYYKQYIEQYPDSNDLMSLVDSGQLTEIPLLVTYTGTSLQIVADLKLTTYQINPDYMHFTIYPNVILPTDSDNKLRVRLESSNDSYITANEIDNLSYKFQYNIDDSEWINVTSSQEFALGYFIWSKYDIMNNIKFRIIDDSNKIYNQETVERIGTGGILDYFNNLPDYLLCSRIYNLNDGIYDFSDSSVVYNANTNSFYLKNYTESITITRYSSENKEIILAKKTFNIKSPNAINLGLNILTGFGNALPITYDKGCLSYTSTISISLFNLKPGFTLVKDDSYVLIESPKVFQFFIPYYWDENTTNIDSSDLNLLYNLVGNTYCIKFILNCGSNKRHGITWDAGSVTDNEYAQQCAGYDKIESESILPQQWLILNIEYKLYIKDSGEIAIIPNITEQKSSLWSE